MPTENRSSEMVSVPRDLAEEIASALCDHDAKGLTALLQVLLDKPAEQRQGEPLAYMAKVLKGSLAGELIQVASDAQLNPELYDGPFAVFRRAYPGEVERLRADLTTVNADRDAYAQNAIDLRAQVAERDALFARILGKRDTCTASYWFDEIQALLSASAAPSKIGSSELSGAESSAPVGRDEPADMKEALRAFVGAAYPVAYQINKRGHNWSEAYLDEALVLARATLGRMP